MIVDLGACKDSDLLSDVDAYRLPQDGDNHKNLPYTVGIFDSDDPEKNPDILKWLANVSGGVAYFPEQLEGIVPVCKQIAKDIRTRYTIAYVPTEGRPGTLRHIRVVAAAPDHPKLICRTRTQYIYNADEASTER